MLFIDSAHLRSSASGNAAHHASDDNDDAFWRALHETMASRHEKRRALPVFADLARQDDDRTALDWGDDAHADGCGRDGDETSPSPRQTPPAERRKGSVGGSWLLGLAGLDESFALGDGDKDRSSAVLPGLVPSSSGSDSETETEASENDGDDDDDASFFSAVEPASKRGVSFSSHVEIRTVPHRSSYSVSQRCRMYATAAETRRERRRNKKEWRYDGCDWRNATEEEDMAADEVTGELVHPAHEHERSREWFSNDAAPTI